jgi:hypothetical protein
VVAQALAAAVVVTAGLDWLLFDIRTLRQLLLAQV